MSYNYNHATLLGRLTKDPERLQINETTVKTIFTLAVNRPYKKEDGSVEADFIPISLWGKSAEAGYQLLRKGSAALVWGRIHVRQYEKDNEKRWMTEVVGENFQILDSTADRSSAREGEKAKKS